MKALGNKSKLALATAPVLVALAVVTLAMGIVTQRATGAPAGNSNNAFAVGGATFVSGMAAHIAFAAQQNPQKPGSYNGHVVEELFGANISGPVICVTVFNGNMAKVVWRIDHSDNGMFPVGQQRQFDVTDNGPPKMGMSPDQFNDEGNCGGNYQPCVCMRFCSGGVMPAQGNIVVKGPTL